MWTKRALRDLCSQTVDSGLWLGHNALSGGALEAPVNPLVQLFFSKQSKCLLFYKMDGEQEIVAKMSVLVSSSALEWT